MKRMQDTVSLAEVPARIIKRRLENLQILVKSVSSLFSSDDNESDANIATPSGDDYGFDKTLVFLTKPNKAVAVSSLKGNTIWSRYIREPVRRMVLDQAGGAASLDFVTSKGNLIKIDPLTGAVRSTEAVPELPQSIDETEFIIA
mmetsp:Transcript_27001/g.36078  ORF Transcript_27001/g.36078 Transcript_27001/m.36078 type:complete len:145 (+) Transcript_27001:98-532(+)